MNPVQLFKQLDELLYEVMSWVIFYPVTLWRAVRRPVTMMDYAESELKDRADQQYTDVLGPPLFLLLSVLLAHGVELALIGDSPMIADRHGLAILIDSDTNLIILRLICFAIFPLTMAVAVLVAESTGDGFENGRLKIRFENQIFHHYWGRHNPERFAQHFAFSTRPGESWKEHQWRADPNGPWLPCHKSQDGEWEVFEIARQLDERAAMFAISMGAPQIMGFNHATVGYATVQAMFDDFANDARSQLTSFFRFMEVNRLVQTVRDRDFVTFARAYNGPGQAEVYGGLIRDYAAAFASVRPGAARGLVQPSTPLPAPAQPRPRGRSLKEDDPELYAAWSKHIQQGFANNQTMFSQVLEAFLNPYWTTVWMYRVLFAVGVGAFVLAGFLAVFQANLSAAALFGGLSVVAFLGFFVSRPLQALEENLQFITWLGIIYNSYWTRLVQAQDPATFERIIQDATGDAIQQIKELEAKHAERGTNRPGLR